MKKSKKNRKFLGRMKKRVLIAFVLFMACFVVLVVQLIRINVKSGKEYEQRVLAQQGYTSTTIPYKRGDILDSNGSVLATSEKMYNLILEPKNILEKDEYKDATVAALQTYFNFTDADISGFLSDEDSYYVIARKNIGYEQYKEFNDFCDSKEGANVRGVYFEEQYQRVYPNGKLGCHLLGFTVSGNVGMYGVEGGYNDYLNGFNGRSYSYLNEEYGLTEVVEPAVNGYNLVTSIDANVQKAVQEVCDEYMTNIGAKNVSVLVMDPNTCDVLALYNSHQFDPNDAYDLEATRYQFETLSESLDEYEEGEEIVYEGGYTSFEDFKENASNDETVNALNKVWRNFAVSDFYEPGSTYKTFTIAGALEEGYVTESDMFVCDGGETKDIYRVNCISWWWGGHGEQTLSETLENSCNDAMMQIAEKTGRTDFAKYQDLFGFGQATNIDIPGEPDDASCYYSVYHEDTLNEVELATSSFGQGVTVSMMQLCTAFCSVINGGYYYEPSVVERIEDEEGNIIMEMEDVLVRRTISEDVSNIMREELHNVVLYGGGRLAAIDGYTIGGKTGTAEKVPRNNNKYLISFIGFAPVDDPQVVIYVIVDEPNIEYQNSCPYAKEIFVGIGEKIFPYLNIYKENEVFELAPSDIPDYPEAPIYDGAVPENDVAGVDNTEDDETTEDTEANTEESTEDTDATE
ncbi:MAG: penicillin-binding protein 2 [Lachnospiraceae bacterium]|nr:penicillin-binding protein 2 [Lachnospiraceae bacterium]